ncbi:MAG: type III secretion system export apparatus subunit SctU [Nitrospirae bacterium]|nr:type III secretion system export apparatus subunit SctU [Nitrospirota bacterium]
MGDGDKTEKPTQKRMQDLRKKGQIPKSKDVSSTTIVVGMFMILSFAGASIFSRLGALMLYPVNYFDNPSPEIAVKLLKDTAAVFVIITIPMMMAIVIFSTLVDFFQIGPVFSTEAVKPDIKKINPFNTLKNLFSLKNVMELVKNIIKITFLSILVYTVLKDSLPTLLYITYGNVDELTDTIKSITKILIIYVSIGYIIIAAVDFFFQKYMFMKQNKMTKEEVKQEYKEMEGDPQIKSKRRQMHQEMATSNMLNNVRKATVLITNPDHLAIALYYDKNGNKLPAIIAKGDGYVAQRMIDVAKEEGIPIMQNVPLAHDLYDQCRMYDYIPPDLVEPIAEVLRWVYQQEAERAS